jgi:hypothetical protein
VLRLRKKEGEETMGRFYVAGLVLSLLIFINLPAFATVQDDMQARHPMGQVLGNALVSNHTPGQVKATIAAIVKNGGDAKEAVKKALDSGLPAEAVISGAIAGGGNLTGIFQTALEAGLSGDCILKAASQVCASPDKIASAMATAKTGEECECGHHHHHHHGPPEGGEGGGGGNVSNCR